MVMERHAQVFINNFIGNLYRVTDRPINQLVSCLLAALLLRIFECRIDLISLFEVRTVNYRPLASRLGHKSKGKERGSVAYSTDRKDEVSRIESYYNF